MVDDRHARIVGALVAAVEFYTRIPRPRDVAFRAEDARRAAAFAPLVGWLVGAACALVYVACAQALPVEVAVVLALAAGVLLTGALHEDGFADTCDAFGARVEREATLAILKDPRCGAYAVIGLTLLLLLKVVALASLAYGAGTPVVVATFVAAHALSRLAAVSAMYGHRYARADAEDGRSGDFASAPDVRDLAIAGAFGLAPLLLFALVGVGWAITCVLPVALARAVLLALFERRIGGYTGDCLGAVQQVSEVLVTLTVCALAGVQS